MTERRAMAVCVAAVRRVSPAAQPQLRALSALLLMLCAVVLAAGCNNMSDQPRVDAQEQSELFDDAMGARPLVEGAVPRGHLEEDDAYYRGVVDGLFVQHNPAELTPPLLWRGRERFDIYCSPCHGRVGDGQGMIVQRGFPAPPSFHDPRLRQAADGYLFDVISNGFGKMMPYRSQVETADRWAIVAYVRVLQLSQNASYEDVPPEQRSLLEGSR